MQKPSAQTSQRPYRMILIASILAVFQIFFAYRVLIDNGIAPEHLLLAPVVQASIALLWGIAFSYAGWRMWQQRDTTLHLIAWLLICFFGSRLVQTALFVQADYNRNRLSFSVAITLLILIVPVSYLLRQSLQRTPK